MKRKSIFLLGSILAGAALVGGTFAAWAVTDNASPFTVKITPGTLDVGENKAVTLEWGTKGLVNIENLEMGQEKGPYVVGLKATTSDASAFTGNLSVTLTTTSTDTEKLINYLNVDVYDGAEKGTDDAIISIAHNTAADLTPVTGSSVSKTVKKDIQVTSATETKVSFYVSMEGGLTPVLYNNLKTQVVNLTVDWNKGSNIEEVTSQTLYFNKPTGWGGTVNVYAWNSTTGASNHDWPGVAMTQLKGSIYGAGVEAGFDKVIFNDGTNQTAAEGLAVPAVSANTPYYNGSAWAAAPDISAETVYYFNGAHSEWNINNAPVLTKEAGEYGNFTYTHVLRNFQVTADDHPVKVVGDDNVWYAEASTDGNAENVKLGRGVYNVYFNPAKSDGVYIRFEYLPVTATKNGEAFAITDSKTEEDGYTNFAKIVTTLAANDVVKFSIGNVELHFYHYDNADVDDGTTYTAAAAGSYTFWVNKSFQVWASLNV